jgi:hypothetical protein
LDDFFKTLEVCKEAASQSKFIRAMVQNRGVSAEVKLKVRKREDDSD